MARPKPRLIPATPIAPYILDALSKRGVDEDYLAFQMHTTPNQIRSLITFTVSPDIRTIYRVARILRLDPHELCDAIADQVLEGWECPADVAINK